MILFPLVSVIIPVYNMEKYLRRCLDSVINNTYKNLEIICVNDGSTDTSLEILTEYKEKDDRIIIIDQVNKKLSAARNAGLAIAKGEWLSFVDSDDWIHKHFFQVLLWAAQETDADISICDSLITSETEIEEKPIEFEKIQYKTISKAELNTYHIARSRVWGKLYRKSIIGELRFISGTEPIEDFCFNTTLYSTQMKYCMVESKLYYYFMREDSAIHQNTGRQSLVYLKYMLPVIAEETDLEKRQDIVKRCYNILLSSRYLEMYSKDYSDIENRIKECLKRLDKYRRYLPIKERIIYRILISSPSLYRAWRICNDPTLLKYEKKLKEKAE